MVVISRDDRCRLLIKTRGNDCLVNIDFRTVGQEKAQFGCIRGLYYIDFGIVRIEFGEDLITGLLEGLMHILPSEIVRKVIKEYIEERRVLVNFG